MKNYEQLLPADINKMGKVKGYCEQNVREAFGGLIGHYPSAKADMLAQKKAGTLHDFSTLPTNVCVPVFVDTSSQYEHVILSMFGVPYEDGKKISWSKYANYFGWAELIDGYRVVKVTTQKSFLPSKGYWAVGDKDERIEYLCDFMWVNFPAYTSKKVLGNFYGNYIKKSITEFQKRTGLYPDGCTGPKTYEMLKKYGFKY